MLESLSVEKIIYPHPLSGPMNVPQRIQFLRFHLNRHQSQIKNLKKLGEFPKN